MNKKEFKGFLRDYLGKAKGLKVNYDENIFAPEDPCYVTINGCPYGATNYADLAKEVFDDERLALDVIKCLYISGKDSQTTITLFMI